MKYTVKELDRLARAKNIPEITQDKIYQELLAALQAWQPQQRCPYPGMSAFTKNEGELFFGREEATQNLIKFLQSWTLGAEKGIRFLPVIGSSGSGKSSLVQAGLMYQLEKGELIAGSEQWPIDTFQPRDDPLRNLARAILRLTHTDDDQVLRDEKTVFELSQALQNDTNLLYKKVQQIWPNDSPQQWLVLVIDQFEEVFTLCHDPQIGQAFIDNLLHAAQEEAGRVIVVITLRADFYGECLNHHNPFLVDALRVYQVAVGRMTPRQLHQAIEQPANKVGCRIEPELVTQLSNDMARQPPGSLPLLQHTLLQLWHRREGKYLTCEAYQQLGGIEKALPQYAEQEFFKLNQAQQSHCRQILLQLVQPGAKTGDARRSALIEDLQSLARNKQDIADIDEVLERLIRARLLTVNVDGQGKEFVEIAHEALIQHWTQLRDWIDENRAWLRIHRRLAEDARAWQESKYDPSFLYQASRLAKVLEAKDKNDARLLPLEEKFISASRKQECKRWVLKVVSTVIGILLIFVIILWAITFSQRQEIKELQNQAEAGRLAEGAARQLELENPGLSLLLAIESRKIQPSNENERVIRSALARLWPQVGVLAGHEAEVWQVAWSGDDSRLTTAGGDGTARIWDAKSQQEIMTLTGHAGAVLGVAWDGNDTRLVTASEDGTARVWDAQNGKPIAVFEHGRKVWRAAWSHDNTRIVTASEDGTARIWDAQSGLELVPLKGHTAPVVHAAWSSDDSCIVTASKDNTARIWEVETGHEIAQLVGHSYWVAYAAWNGDNTRIVTTSWDGTARIWDAQSGMEMATLASHDWGVVYAAWSNDDTRLVTASEDGTARVWDARSGMEMAVLDDHHGAVVYAVWSNDDRYIATASQDGTARIWDAQTGINLAVLEGHTGPVSYVAWNRDNTRLATAGGDGTARVWDTKSQVEIAALKVHTNTIRHVSWSGDDQWLATASNDKTARIWNAQDGTARVLLEGHDWWVLHTAWNKDNTRLVTTSEDGTACVWDPRTGEEVTMLEGHTSGVMYATWNREGDQIVTASRDGTARIWNAKTGTEFAVLADHTDEVVYAAWNEDNTHIVTTSADGTARVWDAKTGVEQVTLAGHQGLIWHAAWNKDGTRLLTAGDDTTARVWNVQNGAEIAVLEGHVGPVVHVAWNQNETRVATASGDGTARVWDTTYWAEHAVLTGHRSWVSTAEWNIDGIRLATAALDGTVRIWDTDSGAEVALFRLHTGAVLHTAWNGEGTRLATAGRDGTVRIIQYVAPANLINFACQHTQRNMSQQEWQRYMGDSSYRQTCP
ncbi:MAG: WD40 repeat domain-containing protein [Anaerolineae bacterium]|nr:WD40 repeat domain-containing protein [Anaerolineae bacterium]